MVATDDFLNGLEDYEISNLSDGQERLISGIGVISASLSILGSSSIMYLIFQRRKRSTYRRVMFSLAACDILSSLGWALNPFLMPSDESQWVTSVGNDATCSFVGMLGQFGLSAQWYSGFLSFYFSTTVRYGMSSKRMARWEPWAHGIILGWSLSTAIVGAFIGLYGPLNLGPGCWVTNYPEGCSAGEDTVPCRSVTIGWIYGGVPVMLIFFGITINNMLVYGHVRSTVHRALQRSTLQTFQRTTRRRAALQVFQNTNGIMDSQLRRVKAVAAQSFLYVGAYLLCFVWSYTIKIMESTDFSAGNTKVVFPLILLQQIFVPLQGFFNAFIFVRPQYIYARKEFPFETQFWCAKRASFFPQLSPEHPESRKNFKAPEIHSSAEGNDQTSPTSMKQTKALDIFENDDSHKVQSDANLPTEDASLGSIPDAT